MTQEIANEQAQPQDERERKAELARRGLLRRAAACR